MQMIKTRLDGNGRLFIPTAYRQALQLDVNAEVILKIEEGELRISSVKDSLKRARHLIAQYNVNKIDLVDELFKMRKLDQAHD